MAEPFIDTTPEEEVADLPVALTFIETEAVAVPPEAVICAPDVVTFTFTGETVETLTLPPLIVDEAPVAVVFEVPIIETLPDEDTAEAPVAEILIAPLALTDTVPPLIVADLPVTGTAEPPEAVADPPLNVLCDPETVAVPDAVTLQEPL